MTPSNLQRMRQDADALRDAAAKVREPLEGAVLTLAWAVHQVAVVIEANSPRDEA